MSVSGRDPARTDEALIEWALSDVLFSGDAGVEARHNAARAALGRLVAENKQLREQFKLIPEFEAARKSVIGKLANEQLAAEVSRLTRERDEAREERDYFRSRLDDFSAVAQADFARAEAAEAEVARLREQLSGGGKAASESVNGEALLAFLTVTRNHWCERFPEVGDEASTDAMETLYAYLLGHGLLPPDASRLSVVLAEKEASEPPLSQTSQAVDDAGTEPDGNAGSGGGSLASSEEVSEPGARLQARPTSTPGRRPNMPERTGHPGSLASSGSHASDCSTNNGPAFPAGACDCEPGRKRCASTLNDSRCFVVPPCEGFCLMSLREEASEPPIPGKGGAPDCVPGQPAGAPVGGSLTFTPAKPTTPEDRQRDTLTGAAPATDLDVKDLCLEACGHPEAHSGPCCTGDSECCATDHVDGCFATAVPVGEPCPPPEPEET